MAIIIQYAIFTFFRVIIKYYYIVMNKHNKVEKLTKNNINNRNSTIYTKHTHYEHKNSIKLKKLIMMHL
jgi:hypothetical protein